MYKVDVMRLLTAAALLTVALVSNAAPLTPAGPTDGDPWRTEKNTARAKPLRTKTLTTFPDGDGKTAAAQALDEIITATRSPNVRDKALDTGIHNPIQTLTTLSDGHKVVPPATGGHDGSQRMDRTTGSPHSHRQTERDRLFALSKMMDSSESGESEDVTADTEAREELVKMLSALEEFHKLVDRTLSHRITFTSRGNSNGRSTGKKNKLLVTDGNLKSTTATTVDSRDVSPKTSTDQTDPKLGGKAFKKSLPSTKKTNKRVCFWKYCSQN